MDGWNFMLLGYKARLLHPEYGALLLAVAFAAVALFFAAVAHNARVRRIIPPRLMPKVLPGYSPTRRYLRLGSGLFAAVLMSLSLMQPQCGSGTELARKVGIDVVVALDVSRSMLARDVKPSRLARARLELTDLIDTLDGDRFGLVIFAGSAFVQCPMTTDYAAAKLFLRAVDAGQMPSQGTNLGAALDAAGELLGSREGARGKVVILLTDGEDHSGRAEEAAKKLAEAGARIFTVGIGSPSGEPIPILSKHGDIIGYKKDAAGNTILSRLDEDALEVVAEAGKGSYVAAGTAGAGIDQVIEKMEEMEKTEFEARLTTRYEDQSAIFLAPAFFFLLLSMLIRPGNRRPGPAPRKAAAPSVNAKSRGSKAASLLPFLLLVSLPLLGGWRPLESEDPAVAAGNQAYRRGSYEDAVKAYDEALDRMETPSERAQVQFNKGTALAAQGEMDAARKTLRAALAGADDGLKATDYYNLGTGLLKAGDPEGASEALIRSLQIDPANAAARHNLELALRAQQQEEKSEKQDPESGEQEQQEESEDSQKDSPQKQEKDQAEKKEQEEGEGEKEQEEQDAEGEQKDDSEGQSQQPDEGAEEEGQNQEQREGAEGQEQQDAQSGEGQQEEQSEGQPESGEQQQEGAEAEQQQAEQGQGGEPEERETGDPTQVPQAGEPGEGGEEKQAAAGAIASEEAERILDALSRGEKPLQMQLFQMGEYEDENSETGGKDW